MPAPVPLPIRRALWERLQRGESAAELAEAFGLAPRTVRGLRSGGGSGARRGSAPTRPGPTPPPAGHPAYAPALHLRREHPGWGAGLIRVMLGRQGVTPRPAVRTTPAVVRPGRARPRPGRAAARPPSGGGPTRPHGVWQVDAAEDIGLAGGSPGLLAAGRRRVHRRGPADRGFPPSARWNSVPPAATQRWLRAAFARWGLPERRAGR